MFEYFYHEIMRRTIIAFGSIFNNINIQHTSDDDSVVNGIHCFKFNKSDIVRSKILKFIISKLESYKKV